MSFGVLKFGEKCDRHPQQKYRGLDKRCVIYSDVSNKPPPPVCTGRNPVPPETPPLLSDSELPIGAPSSSSSVPQRRQQQTVTSSSPSSVVPVGGSLRDTTNIGGGGGKASHLTPQPLAGRFVGKNNVPVIPLAPGGPAAKLETIGSGAPAAVPNSARSNASSAAARLATLQQHREDAVPGSRVSTPASSVANGGGRRPSSTAAGRRTTKPPPSLKLNLKRFTPEEEKKAFERTDFNGNGMLSLAELDKAVIEVWPQFNNKPAIMRAYKAADANGTGFVSRREFKLFLIYIQVFDTVWNIFSQLDTNGDRRLTKDEFLLGRSALSQFGIQLSVPEMDDLFGRLDENNGGFVLFDEFCAVFAEQAVAKEKENFKSTKANPAAMHKKVVPQFLELPSKASSVKIFQRLDFNGNGMLSLAELDKAIVELWPQFNNKPAIMRAYKAADTNRTGFLSKKEFRHFLQYLVVYRNLFDKFQAIDVSGDRRVSQQELVDGAKFVGPPVSNLSREELIAVFRSIDKNGGGYLLFDEFCSYFAAAAMEEYKNTAHDDDPAEIACVGLPVLCHLCGHQFSHEMFDNHYKRCREAFQRAVDDLPTYLRFPVPEMPPTATKNTPAEVEKFNKTAHSLFLSETKRKCPECHLKLSTHALKTHFGAKHLKGLSTAREKELRRLHALEMKDYAKKKSGRGGLVQSSAHAGEGEKEPQRIGKMLANLLAGVNRNIPIKNLRRALDAERSNCPWIDRKQFTQVLFNCRLDEHIEPLQLGRTFTKSRPTVMVDDILSQFPSNTVPSPKKKHEDPTAIAKAPTSLPPPDVRAKMIKNLEAQGENKLAAIRAISAGQDAPTKDPVSSIPSTGGAAPPTAASTTTTINKRAVGPVIVRCVAKFVGGAVEKLELEDPSGSMKTDRASLLRRLKTAGHYDIQSLEAITVVSAKQE